MSESARLTIADMHGYHGHLEDPEPVEPQCSEGLSLMVPIQRRYIFVQEPDFWLHGSVG